MKKSSLYQKLITFASAILLVAACFNLAKNNLPSSIVSFFAAGLLITGVRNNVLYNEIKELKEKVKVLESK